jgi:hypothetical protein
MYTLTDPRATSWAQTVGGGPEDEYPERDVYGNLTGNVTTFNTDGTSITTDSSGNVISTGGGTTFSGLTESPYYAEDYTVPHMQTGAGWEGLGAEYQPGTVEGLGLLAGDAYAPYEPLGKSLLDARPSFMGTPKGFTPMNFKGGLEGSTDSDTNTNTKDGLWSPSYQMRNLSTTGGFDWSWGYYDQGGDWVNTTKASE